MAITKQDLRQIEAKTQDFEQLGLESGTGLNQIIESIDTDLNFPLKLTATFPTPNSKLYFSDSNITTSDGGNRTIPPIKRKIFSSLSNLWIDFQLNSASRLSDPLLFDTTLWPTTTVVGNFAYACLTLINPGKVKIQFTPESSTILGLANPGKFFTSGGLPIGYLLLQVTSTDGKYKTAGSVSSIIENFGIYRFGAGGGGGGGGGDVIEFAIDNNQTSPQQIEEMIVDSTENKMFKVEYSVRRTYDPDIIVGGGYDSSLITTGARAGVQVNDIAIDSSNKIVAAGTFADYSTNGTSRAVAIDPTSYDVFQSFCGTAVNVNKFNGDIYTIVEQPDGKILVGGAFTNYGGTTGLSYLLRFNSDYTLDTTFNSNAVVNGVTPRLNGAVRKISVAADGSVYFCGDFTNYTATGRNYLAKTDSSGLVDNTFMNAAVVNGVTPRINAVVYDLAVDAASGVIFGGNFTTYSALAGRSYLAKVDALGVLDTTFMNNAVVNVSTARLSALVYAVKILADGSIMFGGNFINYTATGRNYLAKVSSVGLVDNTFMNNAVVNVSTARLSAYVSEIYQLSDTSIVFGGNFTNYTATGRNYLAKVDILGAIDNIFMNAAVVNGVTARFSTVVEGITQDSSGSIYICGNFINYSGTTDRNRLIKVNALGTIDTSFQSAVVDGNRFGAVCWGLMIGQVSSSLNKLFVVGSSSYSTRRNYIARLNTNGSIDHSFALSGTGFNASILDTNITASGKIYVGGNFTTYNAISRTYLARLNSTGSLDTAFALTGTGLNGVVRSISVISDESTVLIGGAFTTYNALTANRIIRLTSAGAQDTSFVYGTGFNNTVRTTAMFPNNKYLIGGDFTTYNTTNAFNRLIKLNYDGTVDTTFTVGTGFNNTVSSLFIRSDSKIFVGGNFTSYNGTTANRLIKLNADGTVDTSFNVGTGFNLPVYSIVEQEDGKLLVAGEFTTFNGSTAPYVARLRSDGTIDTTFVQGLPNINNSTYSLNITSDGKILAGGYFSQVPNLDNYAVTKLIMGAEIPGTELLCGGSFRGFYRSSTSNWELQGFESSGDESGLTFSIDSSGQMSYISSNIEGLEVESVLKFKIDPL